MFNVIRPEQAPASLKAKRKYDGEDVYKVIEEIFYKKCYLCETKEPHDINVEHFRAHMGDEKLKFDWGNLYFSCSRCNNIKGDSYNDILDCCDPAQNVFRVIKHLPPATPYAKKVQIVSVTQDISAIRTQELLDKIFNSEHTVNKKVSGSYLRRKIFDQYNLLLSQICNYYAPLATHGEKDLAIEKIKVLLDNSAPYSAFIRWCILEDKELSPILEPFMA